MKRWTTRIRNMAEEGRRVAEEEERRRRTRARKDKSLSGGGRNNGTKPNTEIVAKDSNTSP